MTQVASPGFVKAISECMKDILPGLGRVMQVALHTAGLCQTAVDHVVHDWCSC